LIAAVAGATLAIYQLHMGILLCKARALDLYMATPTFSMEILVPLNLWVATYNATLHTYRSNAIPISYCGNIPYNAKISLWKTLMVFVDLLATAKLFP